MFCPDCGTWNRSSAATCSRCQSKLPELSGASPEKPDEEITRLRYSTGSRYRVKRRLGCKELHRQERGGVLKSGQPKALEFV